MSSVDIRGLKCAFYLSSVTFSGDIVKSLSYVMHVKLTLTNRRSITVLMTSITYCWCC